MEEEQAPLRGSNLTRRAQKGTKLCATVHPYQPTKSASSAASISYRSRSCAGYAAMKRTSSQMPGLPNCGNLPSTAK